MNEPEHPDRLRLTPAPGSRLAVGLAAARMRTPSATQLRALEATMAATLGAAALGDSARAADVAEAPAATPTFLSTGTFKVTAALLALAAAGGAIAYRHARQATAVAQAGAPSSAAVKVQEGNAQQGDGWPSSNLPLLPRPATVPAVAPSVAGAERLDGGAGAPRPAAGRDALALIVRAQRLLVNDPAAAFTLVEGEHRMLAQSAFAQEAEVIAVGALVRLGRTDEARARAARFVARFPGSVHAARMRRVAAIIK